MAKKEEWEELKRRSAEKFGQDSVFGEGPLGAAWKRARDEG